MQALGSGLGVLARINMAGSGDADAALAAAEEGGPIGRSVRHFIYSAQTFATGAWAAMAMGDRARADALFAEAIRDGDIAPPTMPYVHWVGALIAREHGNVVEAEGHARAAAKGIVLANAMEVLAGVVATQHEHEEAARLFGAAEAHRGRSGLPRWPSQVAIYEADVDIVRTSLGDAGFKKAWEDGAALSRDDAIAYVMRGRGERKRPMSGWASLTPTELQVVKLVAEGLSNPQIAEKMFISRRTVTTHLTHIFAMLGLGSRSELAAEAVRRAG
jgi:DNA-binding CsgD family transcriptional regulator